MTATQAQDTQSFRISLLANLYGLRHLMVFVLVPSGVSSPGNKGVCQFGLAYHKTNEIAFFALLDMRLVRRSTTSHQLLTSSAVATLKATWLSLKIRNLAPGVASGYAPGQIKICIFPQAMPQAIYSTIIGLRKATPQAMPQAIFEKFPNF
ncbi:hypothetical protein T12_9173 [Trichinella patagoniensis]|uniref:Uncharacterized protein n=1 Tax=Trichinella patagoniensis TaxID=990121 RepID=A0A0V1AEG3_9BILA|nr:hypothetical protein T12_9173 [Trichinella patagoniensis]